MNPVLILGIITLALIIYAILWRKSGEDLTETMKLIREDEKRMCDMALDEVFYNARALTLAGEPDKDYLLAGEDLVNNRLNCTLVDWAKAVNEGWRTQLDLTDEELRTVYNAIGKYLKV